jgi:hypothetical protein
MHVHIILIWAVQPLLDLLHLRVETVVHDREE